MGDDKPQADGISVNVSEAGVDAKVSDVTIARLGAAAAWLFPKRDAKVVITQALAQRVVAKIREGDLLDVQEQVFVSLLFEKEARRLANQQSVGDRVSEVLPQVEAQVKALPEYKDRGTSREFVERAETIAAEIGDSGLRDMFARILAGELCRPGAFSLRTLETVRVMDQNVARIFDRFRKLLFNGEYILSEGTGDELIEKYGVTLADQLELQDAGLIDDSIGVYTEPGGLTRWKYGDRILRLAVPKDGEKIWISTIRLTRPARELASVLPPSWDPDYFRDVGVMLTKYVGKGAMVKWRMASDKALHSFEEAAQPGVAADGAPPCR